MMKAYKKILFLPVRFPFLFISLLLCLMSQDPIATMGVFLWPYSFCMFWNENEFYRVAGKRKYKYSFVNFLMKFKKYVKKEKASKEKMYQFIIPILPLAILALVMQEVSLLWPLFAGYLTFQIDQFIQKKWLW